MLIIIRVDDQSTELFPKISQTDITNGEDERERERERERDLAG
jgi:hypothetical protein